MAIKIDIGIAEKDRKTIADGMSKMLAETYMLYLKTHNFHWNVTGELFSELHQLFENEYVELADAVDVIAERIRALGHFAPGTFKQFVQLSEVKESVEIPDWRVMIEQLTQDNETITRAAHKLFKVCEKANDQPTCDLLTQRMNTHEKAAWMLRSHLA